MKLRSFGCSFVYGTDLHDQQPNKKPPDGYSQSTWPSLIAQALGLEYECHAIPGTGNLQILESILQNACPNDISIINWTWIDRFDFVNPVTEHWETLRPSLDHEHADYYFRNLHGQYRDMLTNLIYIKTAIDHLTTSGGTFVMTAIDDLLFESVQKNWHHPTAVTELQQYIRPHIQQFEGKNFLDWSRSNGFAVTRTWHPLEDAHAAAAEFWLRKLKNHT